jgi:hypothetical protein
MTVPLASTTFLVFLVASLALFRRHPRTAPNRECIARILAALLLIPVWYLVGCVESCLHRPSEYEQEMEALLASRASLDQIVRLQSREAIRQNDDSPVVDMRLRTTTWVNLRPSPDIKSRPLAVKAPDTSVVARAHRRGQWVPVESDGRRGWIHSRYLVTDFSDPTDTHFWVERPYFTVRRARLYSQPNSRASALVTVPAMTQMLRKGRSGLWVKVRSGERIGWIRSENLRIGTLSEATSNYEQAARLYFGYAFPEKTLFGKVICYLIGMSLSIGIALMVRRGRRLLASLASRRAPFFLFLDALPLLETVICALYFAVKNRIQVILMSDDERLVVAAVAVALAVLTRAAGDMIVAGVAEMFNQDLPVSAGSNRLLARARPFQIEAVSNGPSSGRKCCGIRQDLRW